MDKRQVFGIIIWIILSLINKISAEILSMHSKDNLSAKTITSENSDSGEILHDRKKRNVNADEISRLYDKIGELKSQLEQVEENRRKEFHIVKEDAKKTQNKVESIEEKTIADQQLSSQQFTELLSRIEQDKLVSDSKFGDIDEKFSRLEELLSKKFNECLSIAKENEVEIKRLGDLESNKNRIEQSFINLTKELSTEIKKIKEANSNRFVEIEEQIRQIKQLVPQESIQNFNATQEKPWSNRIRDGPSQCRVWPHGEIPFEIDSSIVGHPRRFIGEAMEDFHKKTCIRWISRQSEEAFVYFVKDTDTQINKTEECYTGGRRIAIVGEEFIKTDVLRQMVYILGLGDEHLRQDRDEYINLRSNNCTMEEKYPHLNGGGFYDYQSITLPNCDEKSCLQSIYKKMYMSCGHKTSLSVLDSNKLNEMYNCEGCHSLRFQFPNQTDFNENTLVPVFENSHENRKYICRVQFEGWVLIGRGNVKTGECHYMFDMPRMISQNVQFLTNPQRTKFQWMSRESGVLEFAIPGAYDSNGAPMYIARCAEEPQWEESGVPGNIYDKYVPLMTMYKDFYSYNNCSSFDILSCP